MNTYIKSFGNQRTALRAYLRCVLGIDFDYSSASFFRFASEDFKESKPCHISHALVQASVFGCPRLHVFVTDRVVGIYVSSGDFVMKIKTLVRDFFVKVCKDCFCFISSVGSFNLFRKFLLQGCEPLLRSVEPSRIVNLVASRICQETFAPDIDSNRLINWIKFILRHVVARKGYIPLTGISSSDVDCLDLGSLRDLSMQFKFQCAEFVYDESRSIQAPPSLFERKRIVPVKSFESRETSRLASFDSLKERLVCLVQAFKNFLQRLRRYFFELRVRLFQVGKLLDLSIARDRSFMRFPNTNLLRQTEIIGLPTKFKNFQKISFGFLIHVRSVFVCFSHARSLSLVSQLYVRFNRSENKLIGCIHGLKLRGFSRGFYKIK